MKSMRRVVALYIGFVVLCAGCTVQVQPGNNNGNPDDITLFPVVIGSNFAITAREGSSAGEREVTVCNGWFPEWPNHELTIDSSLGMTVRLTSNSEARLWVLCGQSNFCGQQTGANEWEISRFWTRGFCTVFVGSPDEDGEVDYVLEFVAN